MRIRPALTLAVLALAPSTTAHSDPIDDSAYPALIHGTVAFSCFGCDPQSTGTLTGTYVPVSGGTRAVTGTVTEYPVSDSLADLAGTCRRRYGTADLQVAGESFSHRFYWTREGAALYVQETTQRGGGTFVTDDPAACGGPATAAVTLAIRVVDYLGPCCARPEDRR